jgi:protein-tyrosine-phosphatase
MTKREECKEEMRDIIKELFRNYKNGVLGALELIEEICDEQMEDPENPQFEVFEAAHPLIHYAIEELAKCKPSYIK